MKSMSFFESTGKAAITDLLYSLNNATELEFDSGKKTSAEIEVITAKQDKRKQTFKRP